MQDVSIQLQEIFIPQQKKFDDIVFPLVLTPQQDSTLLSDFIHYIQQNKDDIEQRLYKHGAILFRGFPVKSAQDMDTVFKAFGRPDLEYIGGAAVRSNVYGSVHTANESPSHCYITFHHEMAQVPVYPQRLFFFCEIPATKGGATPICLSHVVYDKTQQVEPQFVKDVEDKGLIYTRIVSQEDDPESSQGRGLFSTFLTRDKQLCIERAARLGVTLEWLDNGDVKTLSNVIPGVKLYDKNGKKVWFNSLVAAYTGWKDKRNDPVKAITYGDGSPLPKDAVYKCLNIMTENCVAFPWQVGDVLYIDNNAVLHSRERFEGPRRILACLGK